MTENSMPAPLEDEEQTLSSESSPPPSESEGEQARRHAEQGSSPSTTTRRLSFFTLLALFIAFRLLTLLLLRPGGFIRDWSDFDTYLGIAALSDYGLYPFLHYWLEWPPLVPWLAVGAYQLSLLFPPWTDNRLWFVLILGTVFVLFETGNFVLLFRIAGRVRTPFYDAEAPSTTANAFDKVQSPTSNELKTSEIEERNAGEGRETGPDPTGEPWYATRVVVLYALLFVPIYAMLGFFDGIALFFLLLALDLILRGRLLSSAISVGVGFMIKMTPIIFLPVALRQSWDVAEDQRDGLRDGALYLVTTALTILALLLPFLLIQPIWLWSAARAVVGRSSWETLWAILEGYFGFGIVGGDRLNAFETVFAIHDSSLPWWLITLAFGLLYLFLWTRPADYRQPRNVVALTGLTVTVFLLYSKGYSPQFLVYLLPFVVLLFPNARGVTYSLLLTLLNVLEQPIYFVLVPDASWLLAAVVLARWLVLGVLLVEFGWVLWGLKFRRLAPLRRYAPAALAVFIGLGLIVVIPSLGQAYAERRLSETPSATLIGYLSTEQAQAETELLLVSDQDFLRQIKPYLAGDYKVRLAGRDNLYEAAPTVEDLITNNDKIWVVANGEAASRVQRALNAWGRPMLAYEFGDGGELQLFASRLRGEITPLPPIARLASGANLIGYTIERPAWDQVQVTLYWWAARPPNQSYTVFTQVLDGEGALVAGHDSRPANGESPTHTWATDHVYADTHLIELPVDLPPGTYQVVAGMYDFNLRRLVATGPDASIFEDNAVPLGEIELP
jgi:hypothetical protein